MVFSWDNFAGVIVGLSPMADMTDSAFCSTVKSLASPVIYREMVSSEAVVRGNENTSLMCKFDDVERPFIQQIFGADPDVMAEAAGIIEERFGPDGIDINMGCPVYKLTSNFNGAALMKEPERAAAIVRAVKARVSCPVSVKVRSGWDSDEECVAFCKVIEASGADLVAVHGRTRAQGYTGYSNWAIIKAVVEELEVPVLANGDVFSAEDAVKVLDFTGAQGVLVGRGALGNPWIFKQIEDRLDGMQVYTPTYAEHFRVVLEHARRHMELHGERGMVTFRKHLAWYTKGMRGAKELRSQLVRINTIEELETIVMPLLKDDNVMDFERFTSPQPESYK